MCYVASEMEREGLSIPLLIGGATTSKVHTAVKIAPKYSGPLVYVTDASRAVGVAGNVLSPSASETYSTKIKEEYAAVREGHSRSRKVGKRLSLAAARANRTPINWQNYQPPKPAHGGIKVFDDYDLGELTSRIDWGPFFRTWELSGRFPDILDDKVVGETARSLFNDAQAMLQRLVGEKWLTARGVIGLWPANAVGEDDIEIFTDESRSGVLAVVHTLRQQMDRAQRKRSNRALADFVAPKDTKIEDYLGGFAVTAGIGIDGIVEDFEKRHDDYNSILIKALADRLAEAFAERMHERVRKEFWGYADSEALSNEDLIAESYEGIRPAPGYPACPDHTEKRTLFDLLDAEKHTGITLTESFAMVPAASVSGLYFSHPESCYFGVGRIHRDQIADYARRKGMPIKDVERWLAPNLAYDPDLGET
jgi:5-methyltetrahydrofolate--homocysteine methyltransferase